MASKEYGPVEDPYLIARDMYTIRGQQAHGYVNAEYEKFSICRVSAHLFKWYRIYDSDGCLVYYKEPGEEKGCYYDGGDCPAEGPEFWESINRKYPE